LPARADTPRRPISSVSNSRGRPVCDGSLECGDGPGTGRRGGPDVRRSHQRGREFPVFRLNQNWKRHRDLLHGCRRSIPKGTHNPSLTTPPVLLWHLRTRQLCLRVHSLDYPPPGRPDGCSGPLVRQLGVLGNAEQTVGPCPQWPVVSVHRAWHAATGAAYQATPAWRSDRSAMC